MKVLTATCESQGARENDFCFTIEGELLCFPAIECDCGSIDDGCGCHRAMVGLSSHRPTTTMKVSERRDLDHGSYHSLISDGYQKQGYLTDELLTDPEVRAWLRDVTESLMRLANHWPPGSVLERRGDMIYLRSRAESPN
jgi:hypothetical protein